VRNHTSINIHVFVMEVGAYAFIPCTTVPKASTRLILFLCLAYSYTGTHKCTHLYMQQASSAELTRSYVELPFSSIYRGLFFEKDAAQLYASKQLSDGKGGVLGGVGKTIVPQLLTPFLKDIDAQVMCDACVMYLSCMCMYMRACACVASVHGHVIYCVCTQACLCTYAGMPLHVCMHESACENMP
jgi:hypothetical protein